MGFVKTFENFRFGGESESGKYVKLDVKNNSLAISLTAQGIVEVKDVMQDKNKRTEFDIFPELFEDIQVNTDYDYFPDLGEAGFGLTEAPGFIYGYGIGDTGEYTETEESEIYYYNNYMIEDFVKLLSEGNTVYFVKHK